MLTSNERCQPMEVRSRMDSGMTALVLGFFAMMWFGWGQADASSGLTGILTIGSGASFVIAVVGAFRVFHSRRTDGALRQPAAQRRYGLIVGIETVLIAVGAVVVGATAGADFIPVWICAVVGLHFFPLAALFGPALRGLGVAVTGVAVAALVLGALTDIAPSSVTGAGAGLAMLTFATLSLNGPSRRRHAA
jgi:hypothetical protein